MSNTIGSDLETDGLNVASPREQTPLTPLEWSVALFSSREPSLVLINSIKAILNACAGTTTTVDVIINGNKSLADDISSRIDDILSEHITTASLRIWYIALGDKANAWNRYVYSIWPRSRLAFFLDGYVEVLPDAFSEMDKGIHSSERYLIATGVPKMGRSATKLRDGMLRKGGIHGNLYAIKRDTLDELQNRQFELPLGMYRTDPALGAAVAFNLDQTKYDYDISRILVVPNASWSFTPLSIFKVSNFLTFMKRLVRQAQGDLENLALHDHLAVKKNTVATLPPTTRGLVEEWLENASMAEKTIFIKKPLCLYALHKLRRQSYHSTSDVYPQLMGDKTQ